MPDDPFEMLMAFPSQSTWTARSAADVGANAGRSSVHRPQPVRPLARVRGGAVGVAVGVASAPGRAALHVPQFHRGT